MPCSFLMGGFTIYYRPPEFHTRRFIAPGAKRFDWADAAFPKTRSYKSKGAYLLGAKAAAISIDASFLTVVLYLSTSGGEKGTDPSILKKEPNL